MSPYWICINNISSSVTYLFTLLIIRCFLCIQFNSVQSLSRVRLFATPWSAARQASLSITNSWSSLKLMSIKSVMPSSHLILCRPLLLPSVFPSIRVFSSELTLHIWCAKYWTFSLSISPSSEYSGLTSFRIDWFDLLKSSLASEFESINSLSLSLLYVCVCVSVIYHIFSEMQFPKYHIFKTFYSVSINTWYWCY